MQIISAWAVESRNCSTLKYMCPYKYPKENI